MICSAVLCVLLSVSVVIYLKEAGSRNFEHIPEYTSDKEVRSTNSEPIHQSTSERLAVNKKSQHIPQDTSENEPGSKCSEHNHQYISEKEAGSKILEHIHQSTSARQADSRNFPPPKNDVLTLKERGNTVTIKWQQRFLKRRQDYVLCDYTTSAGSTVPVFIQRDYTIRNELTVDSSLQYGMQNGDVFYVYHDKEQKPFQHRFMKNEQQTYAYAVNDALGVDLTWIVGDYLHDVK